MAFHPNNTKAYEPLKVLYVFVDPFPPIMGLIVADPRCTLKALIQITVGMFFFDEFS